MLNITTVVYDGPLPPFISQTLRDGTPQVQISVWIRKTHPIIVERWSLWTVSPSPSGCCTCNVWLQVDRDNTWWRVFVILWILSRRGGRPIGIFQQNVVTSSTARRKLK